MTSAAGPEIKGALAAIATGVATRVNGGNHHACAIELDGSGILIEGESGSGKTSLAHGLISCFAQRRLLAKWVSDDQVFLEITPKGLFAIAPPAIAGKAEVYGLGIIDVESTDRARIDLVVRIVNDREIERLPEPAFARYASNLRSLDLPVISVPRRHEANAVRIVRAKLEQMRQANR